MVVNVEVSGTLVADPMVLKLNKLIRPMIALTKAVSTTTIATKIIEEANRHGGVKLLPENVRICSMPNSLVPKTLDGRRNSPSPPILPAKCSSD
jgi:hypothetical protein